MPGDIARLVIEIDSNGVVTGKAALEGLTKAGKESEDQTKRQKISYTELNQALELMRKGFDLVKGASSEVTKEFLSGEAAQAKVHSMLRLLGDQAGVTTGQLEDLTYRMSNMTLIDDDQVQNAEAVALAFERLRGDALEPTLLVAADLAGLFDGSLTASVQALGKAADMGADGLNTLKRAGIVLNDQVEQNIQQMYAAGDATQAWEATLEALRQKVGGAAEELGSGSAGNIVRFQHSIDNLQESIGRLAASDLTPLVRQVTELMDAMSGSKPSLFFGGFLDSKDPVGSVANLGLSQLADLQAQIDRIQGGEGFFGGKAGWYEKLAEGPMNKLESAILGRIDQLKKQASLTEKTNTALKDSLAGMATASWEYTPSQYDGRDRFTPFVDPEAAAQARIDRGTIPEVPSSGGALPGWMAQPGATGGPGNVTDNIDEWRRGNVSKLGVDQDKIDSVLSLADAWNIADSSAADFSKTMELVDKAMQSFVAQGIAEGFQDIGAAIAGSASAGADFGAAMASAGLRLAEQIGGMMIAAGLKGMIEQPGGTMNPLNWILIAAGGGLEMGAGYAGTKMGSASSPRSALSSSSSGPSSQSQTAVTVNNYAGVQITTTERQTPSGKELQIAVRDIVAGQIAGGGLDRVMGQRYGVQTPGRSAS